MRPISRWVHLMSSRVTIAPRTGMDGYGAPSYGTGTSYPAHLSRKRRLVRNAVGQEVVSGQAIYLGTNAAVEPTAQITLSTGDVGSTENVALHPTIVAVERRFDQAGPHSCVIYCE